MNLCPELLTKPRQRKPGFVSFTAHTLAYKPRLPFVFCAVDLPLHRRYNNSGKGGVSYEADQIDGAHENGEDNRSLMTGCCHVTGRVCLLLTKRRTYDI